MRRLGLCLVVFVLFCHSISYAQEDTLLSKRGRLILPEKGNFALGISANPFFDYAGNLFNSAGTNTLRTSLLENSTLFAKYFLRDKLALRLKLQLGRTQSTLSNNVPNNLGGGGTVTDQLESKSSRFEFTPGIEFRRGAGRLQLGYGGEMVFRSEMMDDFYTYGNSFSVSNITPTTTIDFETKLFTNVSSRIVEANSGKISTFGLRAFGSIEYFFMPKGSIGAELGLGYTLTNTKESRLVTQFWDLTSNVVRSTTTEQPGDKSSDFGTDILNGQIFLLFHF